MSEICKCCGGGDNGNDHLDWCDTPLYDRIADLEQKCEKYHAGKVEMKIKIADLVQELSEAKEENRKLRLYLKPHYTDGRIEEALNNDKDRVGEYYMERNERN